MKTLYLYPGQLAVAGVPTRIGTLLGSCVGVALHDPVRLAGGLNHYLLPEAPTSEGHADGATPRSFRYGDASMAALLEGLLALGCREGDLRAKLYGGNSVVEGLAGVDVGARNLAFAERWLAARGIAVVERRTGEARGCRITLHSHTFQVDYALIGASERALEIAARPLAVATKKVRVLIVDDSATVRNVFRKVLEASGRVEVVGLAVDPYEARELLVRERPDVVLLDIEMPRMTGVDFLEKVMAHLPVPVIMVSSLGSDDAAALRSLELGAVEFVHKPTRFDPFVLRTLAESLVPRILAAAEEPIERLRTRARFVTAKDK